MNFNEIFKRNINEPESVYCERIFKYKDIYSLTWHDVADILNTELHNNLSPDAYRKKAYKILKNKVDNYLEDDGQYSFIEPVQTGQFSFDEPENFYDDSNELDIFELDSIIKEKQKLKDERNQINSIFRRISREETLKEMVKDAVSLMDDKFKLTPQQVITTTTNTKAAILQLSDLHYGIEINNYWNQYNPQICCDRLSKLVDEVLVKCDKEHVNTLYLVNLGDLISGRIHTPLRINSRMDVVTQTQHITELLAQFISILANHLNIEYYDCLDNHSRVEPIKENSLDLESLSRFTGWYLKERLKDFKNVVIHCDNNFAPDIINFDVLGHRIIAVHGDKDKPQSVIQNLSLMTQQHYDLVLTSHRHHFSADEINQTLLLSNGSLMGTDDYAEKLRLNAKASQNLIIVSEENVMETLYRLVLN